MVALVWEMTEKLDDTNWLNLTGSLVIHYLFYGKWCLVTFCAYSHVSIHMPFFFKSSLFPLLQSIFLLPGPRKTSQIFLYCPWVYICSYLGLLLFSQKWVTKCTSWNSVHWEDFTSLLSFTISPEWGFSAAVHFWLSPTY